ncbi:DUF6602 domain-containing protein [Paraburkholderia sp. GAS334]|uniref:DUF6602 domain-containing protein n=1 Tax=Paraburkholderia sp. GAS334 TaxID=3035131 RepID=UPI003D1FAA37
MDVTLYLKSITAECEALQDRVRYFIDDGHWPTDGAWKESILRALISRTIPSTFSVASGFVLTESGPSKQIDVLVYDNTIPVLYRGGDLVFVTPSACAAIIEVKSSLRANSFLAAIQKVADDSELILRYPRTRRLFTGVFSYDFHGGDPVRLLEHLDNAAQRSRNRLINHVSLGKSRFIKFWRQDPSNSRDREYESWHHYQLNAMAPGYFLHNLMSHLANDNLIRGNDVWFPPEGKEIYLTDSLRLTAPAPAAVPFRRLRTHRE